MPVEITSEGIAADQKKQLIAEVTETLVCVLNKAPASNLVVIDEHETHSWDQHGHTHRGESRAGSCFYCTAASIQNLSCGFFSLPASS
ncbi:tautomerase family protein [Variovorax sp. RB2P76]|uniref:tautomerase family protein n=1 Tax=Variovorax sp. RB2P76 TaxID=3443736 RepID=UPI003F486C48